MESGKLDQIISVISKGDIQFAEALFSKPGGRKYLENIVLIMISTLPGEQHEKEDLFSAFAQGLDKIEHRLKHQKQGQKILRQIYSSS
jgi:hypothetical protein